VDPKISQAFFAALLAYYSNIETKENDPDSVNVDVMLYNLLHSFQALYDNERRWNIAAVTAGNTQLIWLSKSNMWNYMYLRIF